MINGAHVIIQSKQPEMDREFFRDVLGLSHVDVGSGWLIFALPPAEVAVHPSPKNNVHEFYLMCKDINALVKSLTGQGVSCGPVEDQGWGLLTSITLPGGGKLGIYEPRHVRPTPGIASRAPRRRETVKKGSSKAPPKAQAVTKKAVAKTPPRAKKAKPARAQKETRRKNSRTSRT
jgi:hypothetical protein